MFNKKGMLITTLLASGMILTACGGSSSEGGGNGNQVTLELFSNKAESVDTYKNLIAKFEKENPDIHIELEAPPEAETVLKTRLTKNNLPDIMSIGGNATYGELARAGVLKDFSEEDFIKNVQPAYADMLTRLVGSEEEGTYGIPYATNANGIIYNKTKFEEHDFTIPTTWDEFISLLDKSKEAGETPIIFTLKDAWTAMPTWNSLGGILAPENFAELRNDGKASFVENYSDVADKYLQLLDYGEGDIFGVGYDDGNKKFANDEGVFYSQGNWAIPEIIKNNADMELGFFSFPASDKAEENELVSGVDVLLTMSESTKHPEEAMKFLEFMMKEDTAKQYIDEQSAFSAIEGVIQEDPIFENIQNDFEEGTIASFPDHFYPAGMGAENLVQQFLIEKNKDQSLQLLDNEWDKVSNR